MRKQHQAPELNYRRANMVQSEIKGKKNNGFQWISIRMPEYEGDVWDWQRSDFDQWCHNAWQAVGRAGVGEKKWKILMKYV